MEAPDFCIPPIESCSFNPAVWCHFLKGKYKGEELKNTYFNKPSKLALEITKNTEIDKERKRT
jgi:hypothetical protein